MAADCVWIFRNLRVVSDCSVLNCASYSLWKRPREILDRADVPDASDPGGLSSMSKSKIQQKALSEFCFASELAIKTVCGQQQLLAEPIRVGALNSECRCENPRLVLALFVRGIKRIIPKFCNVRESTLRIWKLHLVSFTKTSDTPSRIPSSFVPRKNSFASRSGCNAPAAVCFHKAPAPCECFWRARGRNTP